MHLQHRLGLCYLRGVLLLLRRTHFRGPGAACAGVSILRGHQAASLVLPTVREDTQLSMSAAR